MTLDSNVLPHAMQPRCFLEQPFFNILVWHGSEQALAQKQDKMSNLGNLVVFFFDAKSSIFSIEFAFSWF